MRTTSITHCKNSNYQSDFGGYKLEDVCSAFEKYEQRMEAIWGALFEESSGKRFEVNVDNKSFGTAVFGGKILQKEILQKLLEQDLETVSLENMKEIFGKYYKHFLNISCSVCNKHFLEGVRYFVGGLEVDSIEICNDCLAESLRDWK
jgi:hypothetical protein